MKSCLMYPYSDDYRWVFEKDNVFQFFDRVFCISPKGWGICEENGIRVFGEEAFKELLESCDCLWIAESETKLDFTKFILPKIEYAVTLNKDIYLTKDIADKENEQLQEILPSFDQEKNESSLTEQEKNRMLYDIDTPIILLIGMSGKLNNIGQVNLLQKQFRKKGYRTVVFSDIKDVEMLENGYWLSMFSDNIPAEQQVIEANQFIKNVEMQHNPEIIFIEIKAGTSTISRAFVEEFGIDVYCISNAVRPDCVVMNVPFGNYSQDDLEMLKEEISGKIGEEVDYFNIVNQVIDISESEVKNEVCTMKVDSKIVCNEMKNYDRQNVFFINEVEEKERLVNTIIEKLSDYADILSV